MTYRSAFDKLFRGPDGRLAIVQIPNPLLLAWILATATTHLLQGSWQTVIGFVAFMAIIAWAGLEIVGGNSLFRRMVGVVVLAAVLLGRF